MQYNSINTKSDYYKAITQDIENLIDDNFEYSDAENWEEFQEYIQDNGLINQLADNNCIYYSDHDKIIQFTDNEDAYENVGIELQGSFSEIKQAVAYWANEVDLYEAFNDSEAEDYFNGLLEEKQKEEEEEEEGAE